MAPSFEDGKSLFNFVVRDGNGVKVKLNALVHEIPPIDLSKLDGPDHDQVANDFANAAEVLGFFQVLNHGMPLELLESLKSSANDFFGQAPENKAAYRKGVSPSPYVKYGTSFVPENEKALEWKDYLSMVYTTDADALNYWPNECKEVALEYLKTSIDMVEKIVKVLITKLGVILEDSKLEALIGLRMVNMNYYPTCPDPELTVGIGRHSDMGNLTILSNGRYKSAEHRARTKSSQSRVSVPIFTIPKATERIGPLPEVVESYGVARYREVVFEDYMNNFFSIAHNGKKSLDYATRSCKRYPVMLNKLSDCAIQN
ncbi:hypothetical protein TB1_004273 [Malus domestica]